MVVACVSRGHSAECGQSSENRSGLHGVDVIVLIRISD